VQWRGQLTGKQAIMVAQLYELPRQKHVLEAKRILMVDLTTTRAQVKGVTPTISHEGGGSAWTHYPHPLPTGWIGCTTN
jgi:hypothetical protein